MKHQQRVFRGLLLLSLAGAQPAFANQPPSSMFQVTSFLFILPLMVVLTYLAGGHKILKRLRPRGSTGCGCLLAFVVVLFGMSSAGYTFLGSMIFGLVAVVRAFRLFYWGVASSRPEKPEHLADARPTQLLAGGALLLPVTVYLMAQAFAFLGYFPVPMYKAEGAVTDFVAYQLAHQRVEGHFHEITAFDQASVPLSTSGAFWGDPSDVRFEYAEDGFLLEVLPEASTKLPRYPFNQLVSHPAYRADESGEIRMIHTSEPGQACPPGAPVVRVVTEEEIEAMAGQLREPSREPGDADGSPADESSPEAQHVAEETQ